MGVFTFMPSGAVESLSGLRRIYAGEFIEFWRHSKPKILMKKFENEGRKPFLFVI